VHGAIGVSGVSAAGLVVVVRLHVNEKLSRHHHRGAGCAHLTTKPRWLLVTPQCAPTPTASMESGGTGQTGSLAHAVAMEG